MTGLMTVALLLPTLNPGNDLPVQGIKMQVGGCSMGYGT